MTLSSVIVDRGSPLHLHGLATVSVATRTTLAAFKTAEVWGHQGRRNPFGKEKTSLLPFLDRDKSRGYMDIKFTAIPE
jgi:hypothetical protein